MGAHLEDADYHGDTVVREAAVLEGEALQRGQASQTGNDASKPRIFKSAVRNANTYQA